LTSFCTRCGRELDDGGRCPEHDGEAVPSSRRRSRLAMLGGLLALALVAGLLVAVIDARNRSARIEESLLEARTRLEAQEAAANGVSRRVGELEARLNSQPDQAAVAKQVGASVFTVESGDSTGSAFVISSDGGRSTLVTNYHVVEEEWSAGRKGVRLRQEAKQLDATVERVSVGNDVALLTFAGALPALSKAPDQPAVGDPVLVVGAPLGLGGSVSNGIVSAYRNGYIQFSAPIAPGNSGGPVVNLRGQVVGVARSKLVAEGAEGLSFAIPISLVCTTMTAC
jgi:putative serine protease PepD